MKDPTAFRSFAELKSDGSWYAHCIDLTLDAQASSYEEARSKLDAAIRQYLGWVESRGDHPVLRPSPLEFQLRYWRAWFLSRLGHLLQRTPPGGHEREFRVKPGARGALA